MFWQRLFNWFFYGHLWIALAATGLSCLSLRLTFGEQEWASETPALVFVFFATLGVYTLHRLLSFRRAGVRPTSKRYEIVRRHPTASLVIGIASVGVAGVIGSIKLFHIWTSLLWALPITIFYLTPPLPGWRRLRDLPYIKAIWVAMAWTIVTVQIPVEIVGAAINTADWGGMNFAIAPGYPQPPYWAEQIVRFLFTLSVAILFDFRDVVLDRSQGVRTLASDYPVLAKWLVSIAIFICCLLVFQSYGYRYSTWLAGAYGITFILAWLTHERRSEDWYAVVVNGLLLLPPTAYLVAHLLGADAGAMREL
jgi:4-hydroxybenzoate polyprenyltransferase